MLNRFFARNTTDEIGVERTAGVIHVPTPALQVEATQPAAQKPKSNPAIRPAIAVIGAKGGSGATTIAINLATAIALRRLHTTLIDANLHQPTIADILGKDSPHSFLELIERKNDLDEQLFRVCATEIHDALSLNFLSPPLDGSAGVKSNLSELTKSFSLFREFSNYWIIDTPHPLDRHLVTMLDTCSKIMLVFEATVAGVSTCRRWLEVFRELGYDDDRVICVLNRSGSKFRAVEDQLDGLFKHQALIKIPNASQLLWQSSTEGTPAVLLQPNHAFSRSISKLAESVVTATK